MERGAAPSPDDVAASKSEYAGGTGSSPGQNAAGQAAYRAQIRDHDRKVAAAYDSGRSGMPADPDFSDDENDAHAFGAQEAAQPAASPPVPSPAASSAPSSPSSPSFSMPALPGAGKVTAQGAPLILGAIGYCLAVNWVRYGWPGVTGWISAKFWNTVTLGAAPKSAPTKSAPTNSANGANQTPTGPGGADTIPGDVWT